VSVKTIWKFPIAVTDKQWLSMPANAQILTVQLARGGLALWAIVDPEVEVAKRCVVIRGTGQPIEGTAGTYIASVQDGSFVWHIFDYGYPNERQGN